MSTGKFEPVAVISVLEGSDAQFGGPKIKLQMLLINAEGNIRGQQIGTIQHVSPEGSIDPRILEAFTSVLGVRKQSLEIVDTIDRLERCHQENISQCEILRAMLNFDISIAAEDANAMLLDSDLIIGQPMVENGTTRMVLDKQTGRFVFEIPETAAARLLARQEALNTMDKQIAEATQELQKARGRLTALKMLHTATINRAEYLLRSLDMDTAVRYKTGKLQFVLDDAGKCIAVENGVHTVELEEIPADMREEVSLAAKRTDDPDIKAALKAALKKSKTGDGSDAGPKKKS